MQPIRDDLLVASRVMQEYLAQAETPEEKVYIDKYLDWLMLGLKADVENIKQLIKEN